MSLTVGILWRASECGSVRSTNTFSIPQRKLLTEMSEISSAKQNLEDREDRRKRSKEYSRGSTALVWGDSPGKSASCLGLSRDSPLLPLHWAI